MFLHPGEQGAEHAFGEAAVNGLGGGGGEAFFDFVDPENDGGHGFGLVEGVAEAAFGLANVAIEEDAGVEAEEGATPGGGDGLGGEAFAGALDAEHKDAAGGGDAEVDGGGGEGVLALGKPGFEGAEAADFGDIDGGFDIFEEAVAGEEAAFFGEDVVEVGDVELVVADDDVGDDFAGLACGEALEVAEDGVGILAGEVDLDLGALLLDADDFGDEAFEFRFVGKGELEGGGDGLDDGGEFGVVDEDDVAVGGGGGSDKFAEFAEGAVVLEVAGDVEEDGEDSQPAVRRWKQAAAGCSVSGTGLESARRPSRMPSALDQTRRGWPRFWRVVVTRRRASSSSKVWREMQGWSAARRAARWS